MTDVSLTAAEFRMIAEMAARIAKLEAALRDIATPRAWVDMADPEEDQQRDYAHALHMCQYKARTALEPA